MSETPDSPKSTPGLLRFLWRELLFPLLVLLGLLVLAVALVEGKPLDPFLYAVF